MTVFVDTNVLIDVVVNDPNWAEWSTDHLRAQSKLHQLVINPIIYSEFSLAFDDVDAVDKSLRGMGIEMLEVPRPALFLAGKAFLKYRREGGARSNVLADFFIGAHAAVLAMPLLTRDAKRYASYFPTVELITPARTGK